MSSTLESIVINILGNNYTTLVVLTAVGYDYILTFSNEVEYIWNKPWTWVSTLFVIIRYIGLCGVMVNTLVGSAFLPGPENVYVPIFYLSPTFPDVWYHTNSCTILSILAAWCIDIFLFAVDLVMILRVWALYSRSRIVLGVLLTIYSMEVIPTVVSAIIFWFPNYSSITVVEVLNMSFCAIQEPNTWREAVCTFQFFFAVVLCSFVIAQFIWQSYRMYRTTKKWQLGRYVNLFAREGILYFLAVFLLNLIQAVVVITPNFNVFGWWQLPMGFFEYVPVFTLAPRFILNMRALYERDIRGRRGSHMDNDFGFTSTLGRGAGASGMVFAEGQNWQEHPDEEVGMDEWETQTQMRTETYDISQN